MNKTVTITYRIVTPMFIGGADKTQEVELRAPSIKGILRFWYRAIAPDYRDHEMRVFGGTDEGVGQAKFLLRLEKHVVTSENTALQGILKALAYGTDGRSRIKDKETFRLKLIFKPKTAPEDILRVKQALWAFTMFGGLGARSRKGFGSLVVTSSMGMEELPTLNPDINKLQQTLNEFILLHVKTNTSALPEYTCWSKQSRCIITGKNKHSAIDSLEWLGTKIHDLRSTQGENHFSWADEDCKKMKDFSRGINPISPPLRAAFGLPHNYFFRDENPQKVDINLMNENNKKGRRASPLFFHIYEKAGSSCVVATFLPARLIPEGRQVTITAGKRDVKLDLPNNFQAITDLLNIFNTEEYQGVDVIA